MNRDATWGDLSRALDHALDLEEAERTVWLATLCADNPALAARLSTILGKRATVEKERFLEGDVATLAVATATPDLAGTRIGPFIIDAEAGHGGMGTVWRAHRDDGKFKQTVAIKFLSTPWTDREGQARFQREVRLLGRLDHPNIARLIDAGVGPANQPYLVLEFVEGERIDEHCKRLKLEVLEILAIFLPLLEAVSLAHRQLIVHRDLKPSNVMITREGMPKLLDFGIARLLEGDPASEEVTRITRASPMTPGYAAPEQMLGEPADTLADVYALGVLLHELLTGVANAAADEKDWAGAAAAAESAESLARSALGDFTHSLPLGNALLAKARVQRAQNLPYEATLRSAIQEMRASVGEDAARTLLREAGFPPP